jgi:hypothetical protein
MYTSAIVEYKTKFTMYNIIYSCHMNISIIIIYLILTIHCISIDGKKKEKKRKKKAWIYTIQAF